MAVFHRAAAPQPRLGLLALLAAGALSLLAGCRPPEAATALESASRRPNILLVVLCSFRHDHLGAAGDPRGLTPYLDGLAAEGTFFETAVSASSWTKPSTASLLTGLTPNVHQMADYYPLDAILDGRVEPRRVLPESFETLPETLSRAGYDTACRVNNVHAGEFFHLTQGCADQVTRHGMRTAEMVEDLGAFAARERDRPFFFLLFTRDVHTPYNPSHESYARLVRHRGGEPVAAGGLAAHRQRLEADLRDLLATGDEPTAEQAAEWKDLYDGQVIDLDRALSRISIVLEAAGQLDETVIVVTADHGEELLENGRIGHGIRLSEEVLEIPLIFRGPGIARGRRVAPVVRSIDLLPTLAELAEAEPPTVLQGVSLLPWLAVADPAEPPAELQSLTAFSSFEGRDHAVRAGTLKLLWGPGQRRALFDLAADPEETVNLVDRRRRLTRQVALEMRRWLQEEEDLRQVVETAGTRDLPPEMVEKLKALGYL